MQGARGVSNSAAPAAGLWAQAAELLEDGAVCRAIVPLKQTEYGVYGDLIIIYPGPKPYSIYLKGDSNPNIYTFII